MGITGFRCSGVNSFLQDGANNLYSSTNVLVTASLKLHRDWL